MSLNWAMLDPARKPVPLPHEMTLKTIDSGVEVTLNIPDVASTGSSSSGSSKGAKTMKGSGGLWITDKRMIFVTPSDGQFQSLSVPYLNFVSISFEQPLFGSNYIAFEVRPAEAGGLTTGTSGEIRLKDRGIFELCGTLQKTREMAIYAKRAADSEEETLPTYDGPPGLSSSYAAGPSGASGSSSSASAQIMDGELPPGYEA